MADESLLLAWGAIALFVLALWVVRLARRVRGTREGLPPELRSAELVFAERLFRIEVPVALTAKVDRAYRRPDGVFVLLELKTRARAKVFLSDVIELSVQRLALSGAEDVPVSAYGYVLIQDPDGRRLACRRVQLLSATQVAALDQRRRQLLAGTVAPQSNGAPALCPHCAHRSRCFSPSAGSTESQRR